jgi:rubrerythrin
MRVAMQDWIHRYPQVARLLQNDPNEELCYDADTAEIRTPLLGRQIVALDDEEYRRQVRQLAGELSEQLESAGAAETAATIRQYGEEALASFAAVRAASAEHMDRLRADLGMVRLNAVVIAGRATPWPPPPPEDAA